MEKVDIRLFMKKCCVYILGLTAVFLVSTGVDVKTPPLFGPPVPVEVFPAGGVAFTLSSVNQVQHTTDLLVLDPFGSQVSILQINGKGKLGKPKIIKNKAFNQARSVDLLDLNGDGKIDMIVAGKDGLTALLGDTYMTAFQMPKVPSPRAIQVVDMNGDGISDLVIASSEGSVYVALGKGNGKFLDPAIIPVEGTPVNMVVGDFNGDKQLDVALLVHGQKGTFLTILFGDGKGGLHTEESPVASVSDDSVDMAAGDFNGDGIYDLVTSSAETHSLTFMMGTKGKEWMLTNYSSSLLGSPLGIVLGDFGSGGRTDIALTSRGEKEDKLIIVKNDGKSHYSIPEESVFSLGSSGRVPAGNHPLIEAGFRQDGTTGFIIIGTDRQNIILMGNNTQNATH